MFQKMQLIIFTDSIYGFYLGHNQNFTDTIWIVGPLGQAIRSAMLCQIKKKKRTMRNSKLNQTQPFFFPDENKLKMYFSELLVIVEMPRI